MSYSAEKIAAKYVLERIPYIFEDDWELYRKWRFELGNQLGVDQCSIALTGSACVGRSLSPRKLLREFSDTSDIDVAVVSDYHFTLGWRSLRKKKPYEITDVRERNSLIEHQKNYVYWGCIATDKILRIMPFAKRWILAKNQIQGESPTEGRNVNFRIYRDFHSLRSYQVRGIIELQQYYLEKK